LSPWASPRSTVDTANDNRELTDGRRKGCCCLVADVDADEANDADRDWEFMPPCPPLVVMPGALGQGVVDPIEGNGAGIDEVQLLLLGLTRTRMVTTTMGGWVMVRRHCAWDSCKADDMPPCTTLLALPRDWLQGLEAYSDALNG